MKTDNFLAGSIRKKILFSFSVIVLLYFLMILVGYYQIMRISSLSEQILPYSSQMVSLQEFTLSLESLDKNAEKFILSGNVESKENTEKELESMLTILNSIENSPDEDCSSRIAQMRDSISELQASFRVLAELKQNGGQAREINEKTVLIYTQISGIKQRNREVLSETAEHINSNVLEQRGLMFTIIWQFAAFGLGMVMTGILLALFISKSISAPIIRLKDAASEIGKGNLDAKIEIKSRDEIGELASAFRQMASDLKKSHEQIKRHAEELEQKVDERTAELDSKLKELETSRAAVMNMMEDVDSSNKDLLEAQENLKKSFTELKKLDSEKDTFISIAAHELKTPMTAIHGFAQLLESEKVVKDSEARNKYLRIIEHEVDRLAKLVTEVLDLSRVDLGTIKFSIEDVDVAEMAEEVEAELAEKAKSKKLFLKFRKEKGLPAVQTDKERLRQVLINLVDNSIKYAEKGGTTVDIAREKEDFLKFTIADKGIGIAKEHQAKMFTRFYQVENPLTRKVGGTGLGLSICKEFVEALGGKIWFESHAGKGTTFHFTIPIKSRVAEANKYQKQS